MTILTVSRNTAVCAKTDHPTPLSLPRLCLGIQVPRSLPVHTQLRILLPRTFSLPSQTSDQDPSVHPPVPPTFPRTSTPDTLRPCSRARRHRLLRPNKNKKPTSGPAHVRPEERVTVDVPGRLTETGLGGVVGPIVARIQGVVVQVLV